MKHSIVQKAVVVMTAFVLLLSDAQVLSAAVHTESTVTEEMCSAAYWNGLNGDADKVLMSAERIADYNALALKTPECNMNDLTAMDGSYDAGALRDKLGEAVIREMPQKAVYANSVPVDVNSYYTALAAAILTTGWEGKLYPKYALAVAQTQIRSVPTYDYIGYSERDSDDEAVLSSLRVNEPFLVKQYAAVNGIPFYYGSSSNISGWVMAADLAICSDKSQWLAMWQTSPKEKFIVVTTDEFSLSESHYMPKTSGVKLTMGTVLKLVPEGQIPPNIGPRGSWNNYVVYLPTRDDNGKCEKQIALIAQNKDVSVGYLPLTSGNIVNLAFKYLGNTYGWGGMLDSVDCSAFVRNIYKCFGMEMPRNTNWQKNVPGTLADISAWDEATKTLGISSCVPGVPLYMPGHTMIYLGTVEGRVYVISASGSLSDSAGEAKVQVQNSVIITPLNVRRKNGTTWLSNLNGVVIPWCFTKE